MKSRKKILAISGSLRAGSSNNTIIKLVAAMAPRHIDFVIYDGLINIPPFDDVDNEPVDKFRQLIKEADAVFICTPEYAFGVPGALKNALDWTVSSGDFDKKPVALVTASSVGDKGHASLLHTLTALSANVVPGGTLLISFVRAKLNDKGQITDKATEEAIRSVLASLINEIEKVSVQDE
ncbi:MAG: NADPH-dependent FMN reductase [Chitinophagaceae bacterium]